MFCSARDDRSNCREARRNPRESDDEIPGVLEARIAVPRESFTRGW
jgi:hypothetical protein